MISGLLAFVAGPIGRWCVLALLICVAVSAAGHLIYHAGYAEHQAETAATIAEANNKARVAEHEASERMARMAAAYKKEVSDAQSKIDRLRADLRSGSRRLSVLTAGISGCTNPASAGGTGTETRAELDSATADALVAIAADGDSAIRQSNSLIDVYAVAMEFCAK